MRTRMRVGWFIMLAIVAPALASAAEQATPGEDQVSINDPRVIGSFVFVRLENADVIRGTVIRVSDGILLLQHEILGDIEVQTSRIIGIRRGDEGVPRTRREEPAPRDVEPVLPDPELEEPDAEALDEPPRDAVEEAEAEAVWASRVEIGLNGSQGNTERLNAQVGFRTTRVTEGTRLSFDANWRVNTNEGERTANRLTLNARNDWNFPESKWTLFVQAGAEFDEFRDFDSRVSGGAGFNYRFIEEEDTTLSARIGFGFSRDIGVEDEDFNPEVITGFDLTHRINERQRIVTSGELFPDLENTGEFRSILNARWEYRLDTEQVISLALGVEHRYDTQTVNARNSDFDYFARLVLGF